MAHLNEIIKDYLVAPETDYAIMISGDWGSGKSYYIHHEFADIVKSIDTPASTDDKKKVKRYNPAFVPLYGVSSAEDFEYRVFCGINAWAEKGFIRLGGTVLSKGAGFFGIDLGKKDSSSVTFVHDNRVLVFDDLERICEDKIPVKEVLGLINSYAEHTHRKVVIVCNENHFLSESVEKVLREDYQKYKEKSVRFTYLYEADMPSVYDAMITKLRDSEYVDFLKKNKTEILSLFSVGGNKNLRTLRFFIDTFQGIYQAVLGAKYEEQIVKTYIVSFMLYSIEQKAGHCKKELQSLDTSKYKFDESFFGSWQKGNEQPEIEEKDYSSDFEHKYQSVFAQFRPSSIFVDYIFSGYLDVEALKKDIATITIEYDKQILTPEGKVYRKLSSMTNVKDDEVLALIMEMLGYVREDKYNLYDLLNVYALLLKYDYWKIDGFELTEEIDLEFKASMNRQKEKHIFNDMFDVRTPIWDGSDSGSRQYKKYKEIKTEAMHINWQSKKKRDVLGGELFVKTAKEGDVAKLRKYREKEDSRISVTGIDWKEIVDVILNASNPVACEVCDDVMSFIPNGGMVGPEERERIKTELLPPLDEYLEREDNRIRRIYINELRNHLKDVVR